MRISVIILTVIFSAINLLIASPGIGQGSINKVITVQYKNASLYDIIKGIERASDVGIMFEFTSKIESEHLDFELKNKPLSDILDSLVRGRNLKWSFKKGIVLIESITAEPDSGAKSAAVFFAAVQPPVTGIITDKDGNPLSGINITIKGKQAGVRTAADGSFVINADAGDVLIFSSVEFESKEYKLSAKEIKAKLNMILERKITAMREVTVNKGYYTTKEVLNLGNVTTVSGDDIRKQSVTDPIMALQGRVAGLSIAQTSGVPGAPVKVLLRGQNFLRSANQSIYANDPLYVVDGIPFTSQSFLPYTAPSILGDGRTVFPFGNLPNYGPSPFTMLDPSSIESIEVLKDANATAMYGSRGANGVILITTKKGKAGAVKVDFSYKMGISKQTVTPELMNTQQFVEMTKEGMRNDGFVPGPRDYAVNGFWDSTRYTDWAKFATGRTAKYINSTISISGGTANTQFMAGGSYSKRGLYVPGNFSDQIGAAHFNISHRSTSEKFHFNLSGLYSSDENKLPGSSGFGSYVLTAPDAPALYDNQGNLNWQPYQGSSTFSNPLATLDNRTRLLTTYLTSNLSLSYRILRSLELKTSFGYSASNSEMKNIIPMTVWAPENRIYTYLRQLNFSSAAEKRWNNETQLSYSFERGRHAVRALAGASIQNGNNNSIAYDAYDFANDGLISNPLAAKTFTLDYYTSAVTKSASFYSWISYNFSQKYIVDLNARRDGSTRFGPKNRYGNFGSVAAGWVFSKESFIERSLPWLSFGKIRASYGTTGGDGIGDYAYLSTYRNDFNFATGTYLGVTGLTPSGLSNPYLKWQVNHMLEASVDLGFLKDRINLSASYYRSRCGNQLVAYGLPTITGYSTVIINQDAVVQNTGWEFLLRTTNLVNKKLSWNTSLNISFPKNKLVSYPNLAISSDRNRFVIGQSIFSQFVYHYTGVDPQSGIYRFATKSGLATPNSNTDFFFSKPITQQYYGGINNSISYKGFSADIFIQFVKQRGYSYQKSTNGGFNQPTVVLSRWQKPGDITDVQRFYWGNPIADQAYSNFLGSDGIITDASFVRLKNVSLSYGLPPNWQQKVRLQNARVFIQCDNLLTLTGYKVLDPETQNLLGPVRSITFGINLTF